MIQQYLETNKPNNPHRSSSFSSSSYFTTTITTVYGFWYEIVVFFFFNKFSAQIESTQLLTMERENTEFPDSDITSFHTTESMFINMSSRITKRFAMMSSSDMSNIPLSDTSSIGKNIYIFVSSLLSVCLSTYVW